MEKAKRPLADIHSDINSGADIYSVDEFLRFQIAGTSHFHSRIELIKPEFLSVATHFDRESARFDHMVFLSFAAIT